MDSHRSILERVARGELSPEQAADLLGETKAPPGEDAPGSGAPATRIRFLGSFRTATIIGDPEVREAVVDGPHLVRREGEVLVIEDDQDEGSTQGTGRHTTTFRFRSSRRTRVAIGLGSRPSPIEVRVNPLLPLDVELAAGTVRVQGVRAPITVDVSAGTARIEGFEQPIQVRVAAGSVHASGVLASGASSVRCEAGTVKIDLQRGSSVKITGRVGLGKVELPDGIDTGGVVIGAGIRETTIGDGDATLDIDCSLGKVVVSADR